LNNKRIIRTPVQLNPEEESKVSWSVSKRRLKHLLPIPPPLYQRDTTRVKVSSIMIIDKNGKKAYVVWNEKGRIS
jgi:hypothetical protein